MLEFRTFLNTDVPLLVEVWRQQRKFRGLVDYVSAELFEQAVFSKPYFDPRGMILAFEDGRLLGFSHAGFAPNADRSDLDYAAGIVSLVAVADGDDSVPLAAELVKQSVKYLVERGARQIHYGSRFPDAPFYLGLYGGSRIPGVLREDLTAQGAVEEAGFKAGEEVLIFQRRMAGFRPIVDRQQVAVRRQYQLEIHAEPLPANWWDACTLGKANRTFFCLQSRNQLETAANVTFWDISPLASSWGVNAMGLYDLHVAEPYRRAGLGTFLVCESLMELIKEEVTVVEAQVLASDTVASTLFTKLKFEQVSSGRVYSLQV